MSLFELLQRLISGTHNPELDAARKKHDNLPKSEYFESSPLENELGEDKQTTRQRGYKLGEIFKAVIEEYYPTSEQNRVKDSLMKAMTHLAVKGRIFPDMGHENIWYTDYYDLIILAKDMDYGDDTLPHWPEEPNQSNRYLELTISDLVQIFLGFSEEALLDEYQFGADVDSWLKYLLKETLKSRQRFARERQKQDENLRFSPEILEVIEQQKNQQESDRQSST
jgi:hypothetical protein